MVLLLLLILRSAPLTLGLTRFSLDALLGLAAGGLLLLLQLQDPGLVLAEGLSGRPGFLGR